jgi:hypothetical protein
VCYVYFGLYGAAKYLDEVRLKLGNCYKELQLKGKLINTTAVKNLFLGEKEEVYILSRLVSYHNETSTTDLKCIKQI